MNKLYAVAVLLCLPAFGAPAHDDGKQFNRYSVARAINAYRDLDATTDGTVLVIRFKDVDVRRAIDAGEVDCRHFAEWLFWFSREWRLPRRGFTAVRFVGMTASTEECPIRRVNW